MIAQQLDNDVQSELLQSNVWKVGFYSTRKNLNFGLWSEKIKICFGIRGDQEIVLKLS